MTAFGTRLRETLTLRGPLCVGVDPHASLLREWGLEVDAASVREFGLRVVEAAAGRVGIVKPQVSFFERFGSAGFAALEDVLAAARDAGLLVIADAKRGDIGSTMDAYAAAWLEPGSSLEADAVTLSPYLGVGALDSTLRTALRHGKGAFVLAATSNPDATGLQSAHVADGRSVSASVAHQVSAYAVPGDEPSIGLVVGATVDVAATGIDAALTTPVPLLAPGFGAQGAEPRDLTRVYGRLNDWVVASESRSILAAGPDGLARRVAERSALYQDGVHG